MEFSSEVYTACRCAFKDQNWIKSSLNKPVILLTQKADDIPFDLTHYPHIIYGGKITNLKGQLEPKIKWCVNNTENRTFPADFELEFHLENIPLINNPQIIGESYFYDEGDGNMLLCDMTLHIHNKSGEVLNPTLVKIALVTPSNYSYGAKRIKLPDNTNLSMIPFTKPLFPDEWEVYDLVFHLPYNVDPPLLPEMKIRLLKETGSVDYPFRLFIKGTNFYRMPVPEEIPF